MHKQSYPQFTNNLIAFVDNRWSNCVFKHAYPWDKIQSILGCV